MKELTLPISLEQLLAAKKQQQEFDAQKPTISSNVILIILDYWEKWC